MRSRLFYYVFFSFCLSVSSYSQNSSGYELCLALQGDNFVSNSIADKALNIILDAAGLSKTFILYPCNNTDNAAAFTYKGERYIFYNTKFMRSVNANSNNWSDLFILAHEIGHHVNGHTKDIILYASDIIDDETLSLSRMQEVQADKFAGFVLSKLGADKQSIIDVISTFSSIGDDSMSTHPNRQKRINAALNGYNEGAKFREKTSTDKKTSKPIVTDIYKPEDKFVNSPLSFWFKERRYQSFNVFSNYNFQGELGILKNGGGLLKIQPRSGSSYINGTFSIYLKNGKIIRCFDKGFYEKINYDKITYYYLTPNEIKELFGLSVYIDQIKYKEGNMMKVHFGGIQSNYIGAIRKVYNIGGYISKKPNSTLPKNKPAVKEEENNNSYSTSNSKKSDSNYKTNNSYVNKTNQKNWTFITKETALYSSIPGTSKNYKKTLKSGTSLMVLSSITDYYGVYVDNGDTGYILKSSVSSTYIDDTKSKKTTRYNSTPKPNYKTYNKKYYSEDGFVLGIGYNEGVALSTEYYFDGLSIGFRTTLHENGVTNLQAILGYKLFSSVYLKGAIGNANNASSFYNYSYEDYTSLSLGFSIFRNKPGTGFSPEFFYDISRGSFGGVLYFVF